MGVEGLWRILEPSGRVISLETLENEILGIDISLWLHQSVKGFRNPETRGIAHLLGLFYRLCKLLFYGIRPVFVFDGRGVPRFKKDTLLKRRKRTHNLRKKAIESTRTSTLLGHLMTQAEKSRKRGSTSTSVINKMLEGGQKGLVSMLNKRTGSNSKNINEKDLFELPPVLFRSEVNDIDNKCNQNQLLSEFLKFKDIHEVDISAEQFVRLSTQDQYCILFEMKEKRKMNSWSKINQMPKEAESFSGFQLERLLKRAKIQKAMDKVESDLRKQELNLINPALFVGDKIGMKAKKSNKTISEISPQDFEQNKYIKNIEGIMQNCDTVGQKPCVSSETIRNSMSDLIDTKEDIFNEKTGEEKLNDGCKEELIDDDAMFLIPTSAKSINQRQGGKIFNHLLINDSNSTSKSKITSVAHSYNDAEMGETRAEFISAFNYNNADKGVISSNLKSCESFLLDVANVGKLIEKDNADIHGFNLDCDIKKEKCSNIVANSCSVKSNMKPLGSAALTDSQIVTLKNDTSFESTIKSDILCLNSSTKCDFACKKENKCQTTSILSRKQSSAFNLQGEDDRLIDEMGGSDREQRLLKFKCNEFSLPVSSSTMQRNFIHKETHFTSNICGSYAPNYISSEASVDAFYQIQDNPCDKQVQTNNSALTNCSVEELLSLQTKIALKCETTVAESSKQERYAASMTDQIYEDCQELLQLFGIPFIIAPGEAEAQCAYLEELKLTNGTVTDDSDVWVFGSQKVYKNFFEKEKFVEVFSSSEIIEELGLDRNKMIAIAMLSGGDYTDGINNVGPITALEILAEFPGQNMEPLIKFKSWLEESKNSDCYKPFSMIREKLRKLNLDPSFPDRSIYEAYRSPLVDGSEEKFTWAVPNFVAIRDFVTEKLGFTYQKADKMIQPIIKRLEAKTLQTRIDKFLLSGGLKSRSIKMTSKRGINAINKVRGNVPSTVSKNVPKKRNYLEKRDVCTKRGEKSNDAKRKKRVMLAQHNLSESSDND